MVSVLVVSLVVKFLDCVSGVLGFGNGLGVGNGLGFGIGLVVGNSSISSNILLAFLNLLLGVLVSNSVSGIFWRLGLALLTSSFGFWVVKWVLCALSKLGLSAFSCFRGVGGFLGIFFIVFGCGAHGFGVGKWLGVGTGVVYFGGSFLDRLYVPFLLVTWRPKSSTSIRLNFPSRFVNSFQIILFLFSAFKPNDPNSGFGPIFWANW